MERTIEREMKTKGKRGKIEKEKRQIIIFIRKLAFLKIIHCLNLYKYSSVFKLGVIRSGFQKKCNRVDFKNNYFKLICYRYIEFNRLIAWVNFKQPFISFSVTITILIVAGMSIMYQYDIRSLQRVLSNPMPFSFPRTACSTTSTTKAIAGHSADGTRRPE